MAEQVARSWAEERGLDAEFDSAGVSSEEQGNPIDRRAARVLAEHGIPAGNHRARKATRADIDGAGLVVAAERVHLDMLRRVAPDAHNLVLISDYIPGARPGQGLPDPWYGGMDDFEDTYAAIAAAMPALFAAIGLSA
jgi:protein-tyrosine phosphatase